jgi:RNA polymerase sigma-70 factor (ECF subfamily)
VAAHCDLVHEARSATPWYHRAAARNRFEALRETLTPDDQLILMLRVDRGLAWNEIARITLHCEGALTNEEAEPSVPNLEREAARLRKHFQSVKARLYQLGREQGMLPKEDDAAPAEARKRSLRRLSGGQNGR